MRIQQRLWLLKQVFSITLALIWFRIFSLLLFTGGPILLEEPNVFVVTAELGIALFTFIYIVVETTIFIKKHMKRRIHEDTNENQVFLAN